MQMFITNLDPQRNAAMQEPLEPLSVAMARSLATNSSAGACTCGKPVPAPQQPPTGNSGGHVEEPLSVALARALGNQ